MLATLTARVPSQQLSTVVSMSAGQMLYPCPAPAYIHEFLAACSLQQTATFVKRKYTKSLLQKYHIAAHVPVTTESSQRALMSVKLRHQT
jgi:hypothetical protein